MKRQQARARNATMRDLVPARTPMQAYVHYREVSVSPEILGRLLSVAPADAEEDARDEAISILRARVADRITQNTEAILTKRQYSVWLMHLAGKTQVDIGDAHSIDQSTVHKTLYGNTTYWTTHCVKGVKVRTRLDPPHHHGGAQKKLRIWAEADAVCIQLRRHIHALITNTLDPEDVL